MDLKGRRFLVIGGGGFIGSHVVDELIKEDIAEVIVFDNFSRGSRENLSEALRDSRVKIFPLGGEF
jgi:UDP-glucose 4-epimerase